MYKNIMRKGVIFFVNVKKGGYILELEYGDRCTIL